MNFLAPELLLGLLLIPVAIGFYLWAQRRRSKYAVRFTNLALLSNLAPKRPSWRRHLPPVLYLGAIAALLIGLARPTMIVPVPREDATVILTMDVSGSMKATDVAPTRLDAARTAALSFIDQLPEGVRVGIVAFASEPVTLVSPTTDRAQLKAALDSLRPRDGTAMGDALNEVLDIAEKIQAEGRETPDASATPSATDAPAASDRAGRLGCADRPAIRPAARRRDPPVGRRELGRGDRAARRRRSGREPWRADLHDRPRDAARARSRSATSSASRTPSTSRRTRRPSSRSPTRPAARRSMRRPPTDLKAVYDNLESRVGYTEQRQEVTFALVAAGLLLVVIGAGLSAVWFGRLP